LAIVIFDHVKRELEHVTVISLEKKEEGASHFVHHAGNDGALPFGILSRPTPSWNWHTERVLIGVSIGDVVLRTYQNAAGAVRATGNLEQHVRSAVDGIRPLAHDMVETEIKLIVHQDFLNLRICLTRGVLIRFGIIHFQGREDRVLVAHIKRDHSKHKSLGLVRLQG
jgi:hypothetical protein